MRRALMSLRKLSSGSAATSEQLLRDQKATLRKRIRQELRKLSTEEIGAQSVTITKHLLSMKEYQEARALSIFLSMPGREASTRDVVIDALRNGKLVFVPYIYSIEKDQDKQMDMLQLQNEEDLNSLKPDAWGIPSLDSDSIKGRRNALGGEGIRSTQEKDVGAAQMLDLILMPAVAIDHSHRRLGHGKGFYDRYLERLSSAVQRSSGRMPFLVGIALRQQLLPATEDVPADRHDRDLDFVVTPDGIL